MRSGGKFLIIVTCAVAYCVGLSTHAADLWRIQEIFSDATGGVQYIELTTTEPNEFFVNNRLLTVTSDGVPMTFTLNHNLGGQPTTANRTFLAATAGFIAEAGSVAPDFTIPSNFLNPNAGVINIDFAGIDLLTFSGEILPKNGLNSLVDHNPAGFAHLLPELNSPKNFAGAVGSINAGSLPQAADFDGNGFVNRADFAWWQFGFGKDGDAQHFDGDADNDLDADGDDFLVWQRQLQQPSSVAAALPVPEPAAGLLAALALVALRGFVTRLR